MDSKDSCRSWFCVLNHPEEHYSGSPEEICESVADLWVGSSDSRSCAIAFCISAEGLPHLHMVLEDENKARFSSLKKLFPPAHLEPTKGTKEQAEDYIQKNGKFSEKGEKVIYISRRGEIKGLQGHRNDLDEIDKLIKQGFSPNEILNEKFSYRRYEKLIREAYFNAKLRSTPPVREVNVHWLVGESGSGKSYTYVQLCEKHGRDNVYIITDFSHPFDKYNGEDIIFIDDFRGRVPYETFLNSWLTSYTVQASCRYSNVYGLWTEVYITSVLPPERCYSNMVSGNEDLDSYQQLLRRITDITYFYFDSFGERRRYTVPAKEYSGYGDLKSQALQVERSNLFDEPEQLKIKD